jgi:hypothetical protein
LSATKPAREPPSNGSKATDKHPSTAFEYLKEHENKTFFAKPATCAQVIRH